VKDELIGSVTAPSASAREIAEDTPTPIRCWSSA
jgi:hypothetical protein